MPLFGSKTDVTIDVDRPEVVAGEGLRVWAEIGELDKKAQGARIELGYRNTYREDDTDADGDRTTRKRTTDVVVATEHVHRGGGESPGRVEAAFAVPLDAPGSSDGSVAWFVRAVVDRKRARDANAERPIAVRSPLEPLASWAQSAPQAPAKCAMDLTASTRTVRPGDAIAGTLTIAPHEPIAARGVRVQLKRVRYDPDRNTDSDDSVRIELCGETRLAPGESRTFDFEIPVPPTAAPSFRARHNEQRWYLEGVIDVPRSSDPTVRAEVVVHTA